MADNIRLHRGFGSGKMLQIYTKSAISGNSQCVPFQQTGHLRNKGRKAASAKGSPEAGIP